MLYDIILIAILVFSIIRGERQGLVRLIWGVASWMIILVMSVALAGPFGNAFANSSYAENAKAQLSMSIESKLSDSINVSDKLSADYVAELTGVPEMLIPEDIAQISLSEAAGSAVHNAADEIAGSITDTASRAAAGIILIILLRIAARILYSALNIASRLPLINGANRILGGALSLVGAMLGIYVLLGVIALVSGDGIGAALEGTYLVKYFYNNNILLQLIK